jgi:hypothetical protein
MKFIRVNNSPAGRSRSCSNLRRCATAAGVAVALLLGTSPLRAERLSDDDVRLIFERLDWERDRFEDQLDGRLKRSILRTAGAEVNVERFLDDLQENIDKLKQRFTSDYAASAEVTALLGQGEAIQRFMAAQEPDLDGASEWNRLADTLKYLAFVYGTAMPIPEGQQARRMNDREVERAAEELAKSANQFKKELDSSLKTFGPTDQATREAALVDADALKRDAEQLADTVGDGRPASGEVKAVLARAAKLRAASSTYRLSPMAQRAWLGVETSLDKVALAFSLPARS